MRTNHTRKPLLLGLLIGILLGAVIVLHGLDILPGGYRYAAFAISVSIFLVAFLFLLAIYYRDRIIKKLFGTIDNIDSVLEEGQQFTATIASSVTDLALRDTTLSPEDKERAKAFAPRAASFILWRNVRNWWFRILVAILVAIGGLATTILLVNQNKLLETQNQKIEIQTSLMEAERRSALVLLMSNVLSDVKDEIKEQKERAEEVSSDSLVSLEEKGYALSEPLVGRIAALSQGFLPYRLLQGDTLTEKEYSVERGQLLLSLVNSRIDTLSIINICKHVIFRSSYLPEADLEGANLGGVDLGGSQLREAKLFGANFHNADLNSANLHKTFLGGANLSKANFSRAKLAYSALDEVNLSGANMLDAKFHWISLRDANLSRANLNGSYFSNVDLREANLHEAYLVDVDLRHSDLRGAKHLEIAQLLSSRCLYQTKGIEEWKAELEKEKPCLFMKEGCPVE